MKTAVPKPPRRASSRDQAKGTGDEFASWGDDSRLRYAENRMEEFWTWCSGWAKMLFFVVILLLFLGGLVVVVLHGLLPGDYVWLTNDQLADSRSFLFNGMLGGILALLTQRRMFK